MHYLSNYSPSVTIHVMLYITIWTTWGNAKPQEVTLKVVTERNMYYKTGGSSCDNKMKGTCLSSFESTWSVLSVLSLPWKLRKPLASSCANPLPSDQCSWETLFRCSLSACVRGRQASLAAAASPEHLYCSSVCSSVCSSITSAHYPEIHKHQ